MRIKKVLPRKLNLAPPAIQSFIRSCLACSDDELSDVLNSLNKWTYPRGDLYQWVEVLNRCDSILERCCSTYNLNSLQLSSFSCQDKLLLNAILGFSVFLLDHCANRSLYNSAISVNELLNTTDLDILEQASRLTLRLAQKANQQRGSRIHFPISQDKISKLVNSLQYSTKERSVLNFSIEELGSTQCDVPLGFNKVYFWYFRSSPVKHDTDAATIDQSAQNPWNSSTTQSPLAGKNKGLCHSSSVQVLHEQGEIPSEGMCVVEIDQSILEIENFEDCVQAAITKARLPVEYYFDMMLRVRLFRNLQDQRTREQLVIIRTLSVATLSYIVNEQTLKSQLFLSDADIINHLANLLHPQRKSSESIRIAAICAIESLAHHRSKLADVLNSLNASVGHGLLMFVLRKTFNDLNTHEGVSHEFVDALTNCLHYLTTTNTGGAMLCSAGLVQLLVEVLKNDRASALRAVVKSLSLLDHLLYGFQQSFHTFCSVQGLDILISRVKREVCYNILHAKEYKDSSRSPNIDYLMPHERFSLSKTMLKFLLHMMQSSGTADGLRNLIESTLLESLNDIFSNAEVFGSSIFSTATNIMATFIHNEPTSYSILHEARVPQTFLASVKQGILPASDTITAIPNAFGAICLNSQGLELFEAVELLPLFFSLFTRPAHCEALRDSDVGGALGSTMDEFVRHHPTLKPRVISAIMSLIKDVLRLGSEAVNTTETALKFYTSDQPIPSNSSKLSDESIIVDEDDQPRPAVLTYIDMTSRFLEGFLQNMNHGRELISEGAIDLLLEFYTLPCLPYDFAKSHAALSLSHVFRLASEVNGESVVQKTFSKIKHKLYVLREDLQAQLGESALTSYLDLEAGNALLPRADSLIQNLQQVHSFCVLLSDMYAIPIFSQGRSTYPFYSVFASDEDADQILTYLGDIHRAVIWQDIIFTDSLPEDWAKATQPKDDVKQRSVEIALTEAVVQEDQHSPKFRNAKMMRFFLCQLPPCITPFFQGLAKMLVNRRPLESSHRVSALQVGYKVSTVLTKHLTYSAVDAASEPQKQSYWVMVLTVIQMIILEERGNQGVITSVLMNFDQGLVALRNILYKLWAQGCLLPALDDRSGSSEASSAARIFGAIKILLHLVQQFTSHKAVLESPQTIGLTSRDRDRDKPGYFDPHEFLKRLRATLIPVAVELWYGSNYSVLSAPIIKTLVTILSGALITDGEQLVNTTGISVSSGLLGQSSATGVSAFQRPMVASQQDERVRQLVEMGFSRGAASVALARCANHMPTAAEYLITHPEIAMASLVDDAREQLQGPATVNPPVNDSLDASVMKSLHGQIPTQLRDSYLLLEHARQGIRNTCIPRCIEILAYHGSLVFEVTELILNCLRLSKDNKWVPEVVPMFIGTLDTLGRRIMSDHKIAAQFAAVAHLLGKLSNETTFYDRFSDDLKRFMPELLRLLELGSPKKSAETGPLLLIFDAIYADIDAPPVLVIDKKGNLTNTELPTGLNLPVSRNQVFVGTMELLKSLPEDKNSVMCLVRFLMRFTKTRHLAVRFVEEDGLNYLFQLLKLQVVELHDNIKIPLLLLLRHLIEDAHILSNIMTSEIRTWFAQPRARNSEVSNFLRHNYGLALRDPNMFVDTIGQICCLPRYDPNLALQQISLQDLPSQTDYSVTESRNDISEIFGTGKVSPPLAADGVIQFLLSQVYSQREATCDEDRRAASVIPDVDLDIRVGANTEKTDLPKPEDHVEFLYTCLLLQCLTELVSSYSKSKLELINFTHKVSNAELAINGRGRSDVLNYLFAILMASGPVVARDAVTQRKHVVTTNWIRNVIVSLCVQTAEIDTEQRNDTTLLLVRKTVLDALHKLLRDCSIISGPTDERYSRLMSITDLIHKLLISITNFNGQNSVANVSTEPDKQMGKLMVEKNFVTILTQTLSEIDLNHPMARKMVKSILKPLKLLTKCAVKLSELGELSRPVDDEADADMPYEESLVPVAEAGADSNREETPDLYRNSALGMFQGDIQEESDNSTYTDNEDEEMYDEMEFDDEGSETGSAVSDEDIDLNDHEGNDVDVQIILDGTQGDMDSADEDSVTDSENDEERSQDIDDEDSGWQTESGDDPSLHDEEELEELEFQLQGLEDRDVQAVNSIGTDISPDDLFATEGDNEDEADDDTGDNINQDNEASEDIEDIEEALIEDDVLDVGDTNGDVADWGWTANAETIAEDGSRTGPRTRSSRNLANRLWNSLGQARPGLHTHSDVSLLRHGRGGDQFQEIGSRPSLANPLLVNDVRPSAAPRNPTASSDHFTDWIQSIEALIGGGAVQLIGDMIHRPNAAGGTVNGPIRVEVSAPGRGGLITHEVERLFSQGNQRGVQNERAIRTDFMSHVLSFSAASTTRRWQDEVQMLYHNSVQDKALRLVNQVLRVLIPKALQRESSRKAKEGLEERERGAQRLELSLAATSNSGDTSEAQPITLLTSDQTTQGTTVSELIPELMEGINSDPDVLQQSETAATESLVAESSASRQTITLRGQVVDISGLGIDSEFMDALPEDMREEVLAQHIRERRLTISGSPATDLSPEFLEALPPDLRTELLQQEATARRRRERSERQVTAHATSMTGQAEIDPTTFLASLDPALRQSVLLDQDDDFLDMLPAEMMAELDQTRLRSFQRLNPNTQDNNDRSLPNTETTSHPNQHQAALTKHVKKECIQLLDRNGVCSLLRLIFIPSPPQKNILHDVLLNICENRVNRADIVNYLLLVLHDGSVDPNAAEKCFNSITKRAKITGSNDTPKSATLKGKALAQSPVLLPQNIGQSAANVVALQCLQALTFLVSCNPHLPPYFLNEHEVGASIRRLVSRKGKGKDKEYTAKMSKFPINLLLSLLDRSVILDSSIILEELSHVLSAITRPLLILNKRVPEIGIVPTHLPLLEVPDNTGISSSDVRQKEVDSPTKVRKAKNFVPPEIPENCLRLVVNILTAEECTSKTFQYTIATISNLSILVGAKGILSAELARQAQSFGKSVCAELDFLIEHISLCSEATDAQNEALSKFSNSSSDQTKLLRLLKAIDYLFDRKSPQSDKVSNESHEVFRPRTFAEPADHLASLYNSLTFDPLWSKLSACLSVIHEKPDMIHVATVLLPLIEALMVICKNTALNDRRLFSHITQGTWPSDSMDQVFFSFTEEHRKILNQMVRSNPSLMSGSFSLLVRNPKVLEFDNKRNYFVRRLHNKGQQRDHYAPLQIGVRRDMIFLDSFKSLYFKTGEEIKFSKLNIRFNGEEGVDAGGVTREWFQVLARQMFDPNYALFVPVNADRNTYHPNNLSGINPEHLSFFKFVGRIVGKALYDGRLLDCHFSRPVYRKILGKKVSLKDMETLDLEYYKSLLWMLENDITDVISETFSVETDDFGEKKIIDLIPNGRNVLVTESNKQDYVARVTEYRLLTSVDEQLESFMMGFNDIIPADLVSIFNEQELELLISGLPDIDVDDWRNNTDYHNYTTSSPQIQWFWRAVRAFDDEERARLLQFCTGSSRIPIEGFASLEGMHGIQKFNIHRDYTSGDRLPQSHTCFNQLDLPEYESYESLRSALLTAIWEGNEGFGFA